MQDELEGKAELASYDKQGGQQPIRQQTIEESPTRALRALVLKPRMDALTSTLYRNFVRCLDQLTVLGTELGRRAVADDLTSLLNDRPFEEICISELRESVQARQPLSLMLIDLDNLKQWNEGGTRDYGRGNVALTTVADQLRPYLRENDFTYAFRKHGDEFALLLPGMPLAVAAERASDICGAIGKRKITYRGEGMPAVTSSIGVSGYPAHGSTYQELLDAASQALEQAKCKRNTRVVAPLHRRRAATAEGA